MQKNKFIFKVASFAISDEFITVNIHALATESDYTIRKADFNKWLTKGEMYIETELAPDVYSKSSINEYWEFAREVNNTDALFHLKEYLNESIDAVQLWMETEVVIDLFRDKLMKNNIAIDYMDEAALRAALSTYRSSYAHTIYSPANAA